MRERGAMALQTGTVVEKERRRRGVGGLGGGIVVDGMVYADR